MAKQMGKLSITIEVPYAAGVAGTPRLAQVSHMVCDSADAELKKGGNQNWEDNPAVPRDLVSGDLTGTLQAFIDGVEANSKTKEGIA